MLIGNHYHLLHYCKFLGVDDIFLQELKYYYPRHLKFQSLCSIFFKFFVFISQEHSKVQVEFNLVYCFHLPIYEFYVKTPFFKFRVRSKRNLYFEESQIKILLTVIYLIKWSHFIFHSELKQSCLILLIVYVKSSFLVDLFKHLSFHFLILMYEFH